MSQSIERTSSVEHPPDSENAGTNSRPENVRVRLTVQNPTGCALAQRIPGGTTASDIRWAERGDTIVEQFYANESLPLEPAFVSGDEHVYQIESDTESCPCRRIEELGYPIAETTVRAEPPQLSVLLLLPNVDALREIVATLESAGMSVSVESIVRSTGTTPADTVLVNWDRLTERQQEVLETAHRVGYFSYPRAASATDVAQELGIARSTFTEHLAAAQRHLLDDIFADGGVSW